ncbi:MAG TPA: glycosyltransferase family 4 protein [Candidatus Limnocylindrales bacterium]|nr:glycosyltransferase family 4 protein [Candidatus Limnocylindrales bacterium]
MSRRVCIYSPADLNLVSGSSIWVQSVAETFHAGTGVEVVLPLRAPERRRLITDQIRRLPNVELVDPRRQRRWVPPTGLYSTEALDLIETLDRERRFDAILLRSFPYCLAAIERPQIRDRLWSTYPLEPERDIEDPAHLAELTAVARASRYVVVQSEEMRALFEAVVPAGRGKTIILPPAVPAPGTAGTPASVAPPVARLFYAGKFHPFYPVPRMIDFLEELRPEHPGLELHAIGDQVFRPPGGDAWADELERRLTTTPGVVWHGAVPRDDVIRLLSGGGIALSLWDYRHGSTMNDLVVSTKLLDYCLAGVPVILNRTAAQETILGADYSLFVREPDEALPLIRALLADPELHRAAAERCRAAAAAYAYPRAYAGLAPYLEERPDARLHLAARPKLAGSGRRVGLPLPPGAGSVPPAAVAAFRAARDAAPDAFLVVGVRHPAGDPLPEPGRDPAAALRPSLPGDVAPSVGVRTVDDPWNWWRTLGVALAPDGVDVDPESIELARASGARVVRTGDELVAALAGADPAGAAA